MKNSRGIPRLARVAGAAARCVFLAVAAPLVACGDDPAGLALSLQFDDVVAARLAHVTLTLRAEGAAPLSRTFPYPAGFGSLPAADARDDWSLGVEAFDGTGALAARAALSPLALPRPAGAPPLRLVVGALDAFSPLPDDAWPLDPPLVADGCFAATAAALWRFDSSSARFVEYATFARGAEPARVLDLGDGGALVADATDVWRHATRLDEPRVVPALEAVRSQTPACVDGRGGVVFAGAARGSAPTAEAALWRAAEGVGVRGPNALGVPRSGATLACAESGAWVVSGVDAAGAPAPLEWLARTEGHASAHARGVLDATVRLSPAVWLDPSTAAIVVAAGLDADGEPRADALAVTPPADASAPLELGRDVTAFALDAARGGGRIAPLDADRALLVGGGTAAATVLHRAPAPGAIAAAALSFDAEAPALCPLAAGIVLVVSPRAGAGGRAAGAIYTARLP